MNVKLLRKVQKFLLAEPRRFDMSQWIAPADNEEANVLKPPPCGTACCIAGAAFMIDRKIKPRGAPERQDIQSTSIGFAAAKALGLNEDQTNRLYYTSGWPMKFEEAYEEAETPLQRAKAGVARIEHFIKTKGAE